MLLGFACAPPKNVASVVSPTPSPSPTPTAPLQASSPPFHGGEVGVAYAAVALSATGGVAPYTWSVSAGAVPGGLTLGQDGSLSGSPNASGQFTFTIQVADAGNSTATVPGVISIAPALSASLIPACAHYCKVELGCVTVCGPFGQLSGGVGPYSYSLTQGPLPAGTSLSGLSLTGTFGGLSGFLKFTVQVTDALGASTTIAPTFWMYPHIAMANGTCYSTYYPFPCSTSLAVSGGIPNTGLSVAVASATGSMCRRGVTGGWVCSPTSSPPPNFTATVGSGTVNVSVPGQPNNPYEYFGTVTLALTTQDPCHSAGMCTATAAVQVTFAGG